MCKLQWGRRFRLPTIRIVGQLGKLRGGCQPPPGRLPGQVNNPPHMSPANFGTVICRRALRTLGLAGESACPTKALVRK